MAAFGEFIFQKLVTSKVFGWDFCVFNWIHFTITRTMKNLISTENCVFMSLIGPSET